MAHPFEFNFIQTAPGYTISSGGLSDDVAFTRLYDSLHSSQWQANNIFAGVDSDIQATNSEPKSWLSVFTGYGGTITLANEHSALATIQLYNPGLFSKWLFGEQPRLIIQPVSTDGEVSQEALSLAAKVAASFKTPVTHIKATYQFMKTDLQAAYDNAKASNSIKVTASRYTMWTPSLVDKQESSISEDQPKFKG